MSQSEVRGLRVRHRTVTFHRNTRNPYCLRHQFACSVAISSGFPHTSGRQPAEFTWSTRTAYGLLLRGTSLGYRQSAFNTQYYLRFTIFSGSLWHCGPTAQAVVVRRSQSSGTRGSLHHLQTRAEGSLPVAEELSNGEDSKFRPDSLRAFSSTLLLDAAHFTFWIASHARPLASYITRGTDHEDMAHSDRTGSRDGLTFLGAGGRTVRESITFLLLSAALAHF